MQISVWLHEGKMLWMGTASLNQWCFEDVLATYLEGEPNAIKVQDFIDRAWDRLGEKVYA
jgi:hypothetical protein